MALLRDQLLREVSALYGFVDSIAFPCISPPQSVAFPESSSRFFQHVEQLARATMSYLASFPINVDGSEDEFLVSRDALWNIRSSWKELHQFIRPAAHADTLNQPAALVSAIVSRFNEIPGFESVDFTIFHTDKFNYLQVNPTSMRKVARQLAFVVDSKELFPHNLGLIGIPNSQGSTLFLNCLVAHEIGEYAYAEKLVDHALRPEVEVALENTYGRSDKGDEYKKKPAPDRSFLIDMVVAWAKEVFCDLFAVHLIGPCYSFAYVELFDLPNLLDRSGSTASTKRCPQLRFRPGYPSAPLRVRYQADLLKRLDWWPHIRDIDSRYVRVLEALLAIDDEEFIKAEQGERKLLVEAFFKIIPQISIELGKIVGKLDPGVHGFASLWKAIYQYLKEGVVPSQINVRIDDRSVEQVTPSPIILLNSAVRFYLEGIESLMARVENQDPTSAERRVYWTKKVESWTFKALEDVALKR